MYSFLQLASKYFKYYLSAANGKGHGTHSPFVFHFITKLLNDDRHYAAYDQVEGLRKQLLADTTVVPVEDLGAGSATTKTNQRSIASIAKNAAKPKKYGQLLFRMVKHYQPKTILELGTSLGITTCYLALGNTNARVITLEGAPAIAAMARKQFLQTGLQHITLVEGNFDDHLPAVAHEAGSIDLAFIDGNHRQQPTERYFTSLLPYLNNDAVLIFDDIHWSAEMEAAWETIKNHPATRCTVDLFFIGIVFFRREFTEPQHFVIRF